MRHRLFLMLALAVPMVAGPAHADEFTDTVQSALQAYEGGEIAKAKTELQFAIGELERRLAEGYAARPGGLDRRRR